MATFDTSSVRLFSSIKRSSLMMTHFSVRQRLHLHVLTKFTLYILHHQFKDYRHSLSAKHLFD